MSDFIRNLLRGADAADGANSVRAAQNAKRRAKAVGEAMFNDVAPVLMDPDVLASLPKDLAARVLAGEPSAMIEGAAFVMRSKGTPRRIPEGAPRSTVSPPGREASPQDARVSDRSPSPEGARPAGRGMDEYTDAIDVRMKPRRRDSNPLPWLVGGGAAIAAGVGNQLTRRAETKPATRQSPAEEVYPQPEESVPEMPDEGFPEPPAEEMPVEPVEALRRTAVRFDPNAPEQTVGPAPPPGIDPYRLLNAPHPSAVAPRPPEDRRPPRRSEMQEISDAATRALAKRRAAMERQRESR